MENKTDRNCTDEELEYESSKRSRDNDDDDIDFNPRKRLSKSPDNLNRICESEIYEGPDLVYKKGSTEEEGIYHSDNLCTSFVEEKMELDHPSDVIKNEETLGLKSQENASLIKTSPLPTSDPVELDTSCHSGLHSLSNFYGENEIETSLLSELPFSDQLSISFCDPKSELSVSQSICSENLHVSLDSKTSKNKKKKKKKKKKKNNESSDCGKQEIISPHPNYFVSIQISNPEIHKAIVEIQKALLSFNEKLAPAFIDVATMHITLLVAHIATENDLHEACSALDHCAATLSVSLSEPPLCLKFSGLSHFAHQTLYTKVVEDDHYHRLLHAAKVVRETFSERGVTMPNQKDLVPHLTVAKLSKVPGGKGKSGIRKIDPSSYEDHLDKEFGEQIVTGLQLLSMNKAKDSKRYFHSSREALFDVIPNEDLDHSLCCHPRQPPISKLPRINRRKLHTSTAPTASIFSSISSFFSRSKRPFSHRTVATTFVGGATLLSLAFAISRMMRKK